MACVETKRRLCRPVNDFVFANFKLIGHNWRDHIFPSPFGQISAWRASTSRLRGKPSAQSRCKTSFGEFVRVPITRFDLYPTIFNGLVQPSLEIGISHIDEIVASKHAARANFVLHENSEDLAPYFFIRCHVIRPLRVSNRRSHKSNTPASDGMELYPSSCAPTKVSNEAPLMSVNGTSQPTPWAWTRVRFRGRE
jgi:hypothetical protein